MEKKISKLKGLLEKEAWMYEFLADEYKEKKELAVAAAGNGDVYEFVPEELKSDKDVLTEAIRYGGDVLDEMDEEMFRDMDIVRVIVETFPYDYEYLPEDMQSSKEVAMECLKVRGDVYECFNDELRKDPEIMEAAIRNGLDLSEINPNRWPGDAVEGSEELLKREELIRIAIENIDGNQLAHAAEEAWKNKDLVKLAFSKGYSEVGKLPKHMKGDRKLVLQAVKNMVPERFQHDVPQLFSMAEELRRDEDFLLELIAVREEVFQLIMRNQKAGMFGISFPLKNVTAFCKKAYEVNKKTLKYMSKDMKKAVKE